MLRGSLLRGTIRLFSGQPPPRSFEGERAASRQREVIDLESLSEEALREECQEAGVSTEGSRSELMERIAAASNGSLRGPRRPQSLPASAWEYEYLRNPEVDLVDLREELEEYGLPTHGSRDDMIRRLAAFHEENDIVNEGWFEFFEKLSDAKLVAECKQRHLDSEGSRQQLVERLAKQVEAEERREVEQLLRENYSADELRRELHALGLSPDGSVDELCARLAGALDDIQREGVKDLKVDEEPEVGDARERAVERRQMQRYLDEQIDPAVSFRLSQTALREELLDEVDDLSLPRVQRVSEQPRNPLNPNFEVSDVGTLALDPKSEELLLKDGFPDYSAALAAFFKHCVDPDGLGQRWIDTSVSLGGNFMRTKDLKAGKYHWTDDQYTHGLICLKVSERNLGTVRTFDRNAAKGEVMQRNVMIVDLRGRRLYCLQIKAARNEAEPEHGHAHAVYELSSNWVTAFKRVKWPENYNDPRVHWFLPVNQGPIEDAILGNYPLEFNASAIRRYD